MNVSCKKYQLKAGSLANMQKVETSLPPPGPKEVQIAIKAIGLNFADVFAIWGLYSATPKGIFTPGLEYSGEIIQVGSQISDFKKGDKVIGVTKFGAFATCINADILDITPLTEDWTFEEGASFPVQALTAWYGLIALGQLKAGQNVLIHSAAGGVGIWANRIARHFGASTVGTVGHADKLSLCRKEQFDQAFVRKPPQFKEQVLEAFNGGHPDLIMECIGGSILKDGFDLLAPRGKMIVYGSAHYAAVGKSPNYFQLGLKYWQRPKIDPQAMIARNVSLMAFNLIYLYEDKALMHQMFRDILAIHLDKPIVGHIFPFDEMEEAILFFQSGLSTGKIVVQVE